MDTLHQALRGAAHHRPGALLPQQRVLVLGAGGRFGSAILAEALVAGRFARVRALVSEPLASAVRGFEPLPLWALAEPGQGIDTAFIVLERQRRSNGRDAAFVQPALAALWPLARSIHAAGVQRLLVLVPHAPALLPQALNAGLASTDEAAVAALGFEHLVFLRAAQDNLHTRAASWPQRLAGWWLAQLRWMVPSAQQALRPADLARLLVHLVQRLPAAPPGTRVMSSETLWLARAAGPAWCDDWLQGRPTTGRPA